MKVNSKDLIQSYILTTAKYDYSVYEKRILYRIIELMQDYTKGIPLTKKYSIQKTIFDDVDITMPINAFLKSEDDNNYSRIKKALLALNSKVIQYEDESTWGALNLIERPEIHKKGDFVAFRVSPKIAKAFMDFSKGFSKYELITAMQFESTYAMRFYELLNGQKRPITYTIENLKIMFKIENKYDRVNDFFRKVIDVAKKELDKKSPHSFNYKPIKKGRSITAIMFYPIAQPKNRDAELAEMRMKKKVSVHWDLDQLVIQYLRENYIFSDDEIKNNIELFKIAQKELDLLYFLSEQIRNSETKKNPKGWLINAIKKQLEQKGIELNKSKAAPAKQKNKTPSYSARKNSSGSIKDLLTNIMKQE